MGGDGMCVHRALQIVHTSDPPRTRHNSPVVRCELGFSGYVSWVQRVKSAGLCSENLRFIAHRAAVGHLGGSPVHPSPCSMPRSSCAVVCGSATSTSSSRPARTAAYASHRRRHLSMMSPPRHLCRHCCHNQLPLRHRCRCPRLFLPRAYLMSSRQHVRSALKCSLDHLETTLLMVHGAARSAAML